MSIRSEIDETLRLLGSAQPPPGLERRVNLRLQSPRSHFSIVQAFFACAVTASVAISVVTLNPALRRLVFHQHSGGPATHVVAAPRVVAPAPGGFGTASAVHVPVEPVPVQPTPVNQGRGRSRSGRAVLPTGNLAPLPRGVASPHGTPAVSPDPTH